MAVGAFSGGGDVLRFRNCDDEWVDIFPDFIRNALISVDSELKEYQVVQSKLDTLLIRLSPLNEVLPAKVAIVLDRLFEQLGVKAPLYRFEHYENGAYCQKKRRVMRLIDG